MAKKPQTTIEIRDQWLNLQKMTLPGGLKREQIEEAVETSPVNIALQVLLPSGTSMPERFIYSRNGEIKSFRKGVEEKIIDAFKLIVEARELDGKGDPKGAKQAKDTLKKINGYVKKAMSQYRVVLRTVIAKAIGGKTTADDLMTVGSSGFKEMEIRVGAFESDTEDEFDSPLLDLSKALKRKGEQHCGVAWKAKKCVLSVKLKKAFKATELKELRELISKDALMVAGRFRMVGSKAHFEFPDDKKNPGPTKLRRAIKEQAQKAIGVLKPIGLYNAKEEEAEETKTKAKGTKGNKEKKEKKKE